MEHNFNPNKGDYKYILEEEQGKQTGEASTPPVLEKQKIFDRFCNWITLHLLRRSNKIKLAFTVFVEYYY